MLAQSALGQQCVSVAAGNWSAAGTWSCTGGATAPPTGAFTGYIVIKHAITLDATQTITGLTIVDIVPGGQLTFNNARDLNLTDNGSKINLYTSTALITGGNSNSDLTIGTSPQSLSSGAFNIVGPITLTNSGTVTLSNTLTLTAATSATAICLGNSASLSISTTGGTTPYSYSWVAPAGATLSPASSSITSATITTAGVKTFTVTVTDGVGRINSTTLNVTGTPFSAFTSLTTTQSGGGYCSAGTARNVINISATVTNATAYTVIGPGNTAGSTGGTTWTTFGSSASATGTLTGSPTSFSVNRDASSPRAGTYTIIVTNASGCQSTSTVSVTVLTSPTVTVTPSSQTTCSSQQPVSLTATAGSGTGAYTYSWEIAPGTTGGTFATYPGSTSVISSSVLTAFTSGTAAARYRSSVTDANACQANTDVGTVFVLQTPSVILANNGPITCAQTAITLTATATGGVIPYSYTFSGPGLSPTASTSTLVVSAAQEGLYSVTVSAAGCTTTATTTVTSSTTPPGITQNGSTTHVTCNGLADGALSVDVTGDFPFTVTAGSGLTALVASSGGTASFTGLIAGTYSVTVTNVNGCTAVSTPVSVTQPPVLSLSTPTITTVVCNGGSTGAIALVASGGTSPYTYTITGGATNSTGSFTGLAAGSFTVTASDANGCTIASGAIAVAGPSALSLSAPTVTTVVCSGGSTGAIALVGSGGAGTYSYTITGGVTNGTGSFSGLAAGSFTVTASDANGCTIASGAIVVAGPTALSLSAPTVTTVVCNGGSTGAIALAASGGAGTYSYTITGGVTNSSGSFSGLAAGSFTVTASDANGCTIASGAIVVAEPTALSLSTPTVTTVVCAGGSTGAVALAASGGAGTYSYTITGGATNSTGSFTGLAASSFTITASDANGCTIASGAIVVAEPTALSLSAPTVTTVVCAGGSTGAIALAASGGAGTYSYTITGGTTNSTGSFSGLVAGSYTVTAGDVNGCTIASGAIAVAGPSALSLSTPTVTTVVCNGGNVGAISLAATGGAGTYSYTITGGATNNTGSFTGLSAGSYTITASDANGCTIASGAINVSQSTALSLSTPTVTTVVCAGGSTGAIALVASGGAGTYSYTITGGTTNSTGSFTGLAAGSFTVTASDANGCTITSGAIVVAEPTALSLSTPTVTTVVCAGGSTGAVALAASGGAGTYSYTITGGATNSSGSFSGLAAGSFTVTASDANGCTIASGAIVVAGPTALSLSAPTVTTVACKASSTGAIALVASGGAGTYSYTITGGATNSSGSFTGLVAGSYTITASDANGCTIASGAIPVAEPVSSFTATLLPASTTVCAGAIVSLTTSTSGGAGVLAYAYVPTVVGSGSVVTAPLPVSAVQTSVTYSVTVTDGNGCTAVSSNTITVNPQPTLTALAVAPVCVGNPVSVTLSGLLINLSQTVSYSIGGGAVQSVTVTADGSGNASFITAAMNTSNVGQSIGVSGIMLVSSGCSQTFSSAVSLTVNALPSPTLTANPSATVSCANPSLTLTAGGGSTYSFANGGSPISSTGNLAIINVGGTYSVTVTSASGCSSTTSVVVSQSLGLPTPGLVASGTLTCTVTAVTLTASGGNSYTFSGAGIVSQNAAAGTAVVNAGGVYSVTVMNTATGCFNTTTTMVQSNTTAPTAGLVNSGTVTCANPTVILTASGGSTYGFTGTGLVASSGGSATVNQGGTFSVVVTGSNGCTALATSTVQSNTIAPTAGLVVSGTITCLSPTASLTASGGGTYAFAGPGLVGSAGNLATVNAGGLYSVTVTGANGCSSTATVTVVINLGGGAPTPVLNASSSVVCQGSNVLVVATVGGSFTGLQWYKDGVSLGAAGQTAMLSLGNVQVAQSGSYMLVATGVCGSVTSTAFSLTVKPLPVVVLTFPSGSTVVGPGSVVGVITIPAPLTGAVFQVTGGISYERFIVIDRINGYEIRQVDTNGTGIFSITRPGPFRLTVTGANGCQRVVEGVIVVAP